jgi:hypothetical protein
MSDSRFTGTYHITYPQWELVSHQHTYGKFDAQCPVDIRTCNHVCYHGLVPATTHGTNVEMLRLCPNSCICCRMCRTSHGGMRRYSRKVVGRSSCFTPYTMLRDISDRIQSRLSSFNDRGSLRYFLYHTHIP